MVRAHASSVNPADWHLIRGEPRIARLQLGLGRPRQEILGCDVAGTVEAVGAGADEAAARRPAVVAARSGFRLAVVGVTDHPVDYAAGPARPGVAHADLRSGVPSWLRKAVAGCEADAVLVTPHWGPNMATSPQPYVRAAAAELLAAGATFVAGHSAHVFHGVEGRVLYDLGDFLDDYRVDPVLRNDLGILVLVTLDALGPRRLEAVPLALGYARTELAAGADADIVIADLDLEQEARADALLSGQDHCPFEGVQVRGWPVTTIVSGRVAYRDGAVVGEPSGVYLSRR